MSRRLRQEIEYAKLQRLEAEEEDDKIKKMQERIFNPIVWCRMTSGYRIQDLKEKQYQEILDMILVEFIPCEVISRNSEMIEDEASVKSSLAHYLFYMKGSCSIVALDENNDNEIAGVLIMKVDYLKDHDLMLARVIHTQGTARGKNNNIKITLVRYKNLYEMYNCDSLINYQLLCIKKKHRGKNLGYQLMRNGLNASTSLHVPVADGIFSSMTLQNAAYKLGFKLITEISYTNWLDAENELIFNDPGAGNYTCALMACEVPQKKIIDPSDIIEKRPDELKVPAVPRTRAEKRNFIRLKEIEQQIHEDLNAKKSQDLTNKLS